MDNWGYTFIVLAVCVEIVAILNLVFLVEYPLDKGIIIREKANIINPTETDRTVNIEEGEEDIEDSD